MDTLLLQIVLLHEERVSKLGTTLREELSPELQTVDVIGSSIIAANVDVRLAGLDPAVWRAAAVGFLEDSGPILDGAEEVADVNEVKGVVVPCPAEGGVVDLKFNIGRDPAVDGECDGLQRLEGECLRRLNGREVGADDFGLGVLVRKVTDEMSIGRRNYHKRESSYMAQIP